MLWFKFILGLNFLFFCFKVIIIHYHTQKQKKIKFKPSIKLNHNIYVGAGNGIIHKEFLPNCMLILMKHGRGLIVGEFIIVLFSLLFLLGGLAFYRMGA